MYIFKAELQLFKVVSILLGHPVYFLFHFFRMVIMHTFEQPTCVQPHILRTNCTVDGPFVITLYNKSLQEALLVTVNEASQDHCHTQCLLNDHCKSVNYHSDNKICELNSKTLGDSKTELKSMMGWMYQSTNYSSMAVGSLAFILTLRTE